MKAARPAECRRWRDRGPRGITPTLGRRHAFNSGKAQQVLDWKPRPGRAAVVACAQSLIAVGAG